MALFRSAYINTQHMATLFFFLLLFLLFVSLFVCFVSFALNSQERQLKSSPIIPKGIFKVAFLSPLGP